MKWELIKYISKNVMLSIRTGNMEKQETETGNGNWKQKPETNNKNGNATSSLL